ncbi:MAG TPA: translation initiation factor IF-2 [Candidatus Pacearchaeota archaeon]|nr:translation initiation factor IF-2 [Candidatus Parcubacteria bacterium]HNZ83809.1 translation initiation factor IF-2 [Candidatus Pacearchaeota archaeon]HPM08770.1 translation initiation factor IF-2 [Candidatus Pacearchaeota archaeon]
MTVKRAPIVVVLGHVDHGKTTILDYIKKSNVAARESGGITQHIGAYEIEYNGNKITFIDTPGHAAFSSMRSRGAKVADIAILVVAADDGVKEQTKEAINVIKNANIPFIVAINKVDIERANPEKVKMDLSKYDVMLESIGGDVPSVNTSAKQGTGINDLLDLVVLISEMNDLKADPDSKATGTVIESKLDKLRGPTATLLITDGTLKVGDIIGSATANGKIKAIEDFRGKQIKQALPSQPCSVLGLSKIPFVGEEFFTFNSIQEAQEFEKEALKKPQIDLSEEKDKKYLNIILKADVHGSLEALEKMIQEIPTKDVVIRILKKEVGNVTEDDVKLAETCKAKIVTFRVKADSNIERLADDRKIKIMGFDIIYNLIQALEIMCKALIEPKNVREDQGKMKALIVFFTEGSRQIVGGRVTDGFVEKGAQMEIYRDEKLIGKGRMVGLQKNKKPIDKAIKRDEIGVLFEGNIKIQVDDTIVFYVISQQKN